MALKLAQSGLGDHFDGVEIVSEKTAPVYARIFPDAARAMMVVNSMRSDVLPAIAAGAHGVHVPHDLTWALEAAEPPRDQPRFHRLASLAALPDLVLKLR